MTSLNKLVPENGAPSQLEDLRKVVKFRESFMARRQWSILPIKQTTVRRRQPSANSQEKLGNFFVFKMCASHLTETSHTNWVPPENSRAAKLKKKKGLNPDFCCHVQISPARETRGATFRGPLQREPGWGLLLDGETSQI
jgi:hypothetical protein